MNLQKETKITKNERIMNAFQVTQKVSWIDFVYSILLIETLLPYLPSVQNHFSFGQEFPEDNSP